MKVTKDFLLKLKNKTTDYEFNTRYLSHIADDLLVSMTKTSGHLLGNLKRDAEAELAYRKEKLWKN